MKKQMLLLTLSLSLTLLLTACGGAKNTTAGWYLQAENGTHILITEEGEPLTLSDRSRGQALFEGLRNGEQIEITHDAIAETYPGQAGAFTCKLLGPGSAADIPAKALSDLEDCGYTFDLHTHVPAEEPLTVDDPVSGYCGNTTTEVLLNGETYSFWGSDSVTLTDILINLDYDPAQVCRCATEFTVNTEFGGGYGVNSEQAFARCETGQAALTEKQTAQILEIIEKNCT